MIILAVITASLGAANPPVDGAASEETAQIDTPRDCTFGYVFPLWDGDRPVDGYEIKVSGRLHGFDFRKTPSRVLLAFTNETGKRDTICLGMTDVKPDGTFECRCTRFEDPKVYDTHFVRLHVTVHDGKDWRESFKFCGLLDYRP
jgi:hypothetical protein